MTQLEQRKKVKTLIDAGITFPTEISRRTRIPIRTVFRIKYMVREGKSLQHKSVSGRPKVITYSQKQSIIRTLNCYPKMSTRSLHANLSSKFTDTPSSRLSIERLARVDLTLDPLLLDHSLPMKLQKRELNGVRVKFIKSGNGQMFSSPMNAQSG